MVVSGDGKVGAPPKDKKVGGRYISDKRWRVGDGKCLKEMVSIGCSR